MIQPATPEAIAQAAELLRGGGLAAFPTETVYGLGADAANGLAIARLFEAKGRPRFNPLIVHVTNLDKASRYACFNGLAQNLAAAFWPGPLTLVLPLRAQAGIAEIVTAGLPTVAIRVPAHPVAQALISAAGVPVAAPSANASGHVSPTMAAHVFSDLGSKVDMILDGGTAVAGIESTIVGFDGEMPLLLRPGAVPREAIEAAAGCQLAATAYGARPNAPGQLTSHYAPHASLRMNARHAKPRETLLAFGPDAPDDALNLSRSSNLREAAANLFASLRRLDEAGAKAIAVMPIPKEGPGEAINDRLCRAAAPRNIPE